VLWLQTVRDQVAMPKLEQAIADSGVTAAFQALNLEATLEAVAQGAHLTSRANSLLDALQAIYREGAQLELDRLSKISLIGKARKPKIGMTMTFDFLNPESLAFLQSYTFNLIREVNKETRLAVQDILIRAFQQGGHPKVIAREIREFIGLTRRQAQAVDNYRAMLESGNVEQMRTALERSLRDGRFDRSVLRSIEQGARLPQDRIDHMVERYRERALQNRAVMIARTETIRASNAGSQAVWDQAKKQGLLGDETRKRWLVAFDERTCEICKEIARLNKAGVPLNSSFQSSMGPIEAPPAHPNCRCSVGLDFGGW
jgi:hypothetical protein